MEKYPRKILEKSRKNPGFSGKPDWASVFPGF